MHPLFCNTEVRFEDIGKHMQEYIQKEGLGTHPRRLLVEANSVGYTFIEMVFSTRPEIGIIGDTMKLIGNLGYGSLLIDKTEHRNIMYVQGERDTCLAINRDEFRNATC